MPGKTSKVHVTPAKEKPEAPSTPKLSHTALTEDEIKVMQDMEAIQDTGNGPNRPSSGRKSKRAWSSGQVRSSLLVSARTSSKYPHDRQMRVDRGKADIGGESYCKNTVITSSYTIWNFPLKNLWLQFQNLANVYFLFVGILQCIPSVSTTNGAVASADSLLYSLLVHC